MSNRKTYGALSALAGAAVFFAMSYTPASAQGMPQGWFKVCSKQQDVDVCNTLNNVVSETGQPLTIVNLIEFSGKQNQKRLRITVPTGRLIPEGVRVQVGDAPAKKVDYVFCFGPTCVADTVLDEKLLAALKKGNKMTVTSVNFQGGVNPIDVSLQGFTQAFTGPGMQEKDFEAQQKKLQLAIQAKEKQRADQLKSVQEKAKAPN